MSQVALFNQNGFEAAHSQVSHHTCASSSSAYDQDFRL
jgi:hypothetical protein